MTASVYLSITRCPPSQKDADGVIIAAGSGVSTSRDMADGRNYSLMMERHAPLGASLRTVGDVTCGRIASRAQYCLPMLLQSWLVVMTGCLTISAGCSSVPPFVESMVTGEAPRDTTYAGRQHFPVSPDEAVECLVEVARQQGWEVVSAGDEQDPQGERGKFFRIETAVPSGGTQSVSGIFYAEPSGSYVRISEENGLPETLVEPLIAEIKKKKDGR
jgi:hypothetical protein